MDMFSAVLDKMLTLFLCMAVGYILCKAKILPHDAGKTMAKLLTWVFSPALTFYAMSVYCTTSNFAKGGSYILIAGISVTVALALSIPVSKLFVKDNSYARGVYKYALTFGNSGYVGSPLVLALFGDTGFFWYNLICLPINIVIFTWGISVLVAKKEGEKRNNFKSLLNAPMIATFIGIIVGLTGLGNFIIGIEKTTFFGSTLTSLKSCYGPVAMLLAGFTVARFDFLPMLKNVRVYFATALRLVVLPIILIGLMYAVMLLLNVTFNFTVDTFILFMLFFAVATPLGLNTVVFPEAFGGDPSTGASMAMISHTLCVLTIPLMFTLMGFIFGTPVVPIV